MSRVRNFALPSLPYLAAGLAVALVIGLSWVLPATHAGTVQKQTAGVERTVSVDGRTSRSIQYEWTDTIVLNVPPREVKIHPRIRASIETPYTEDSGRADLELDTRVFINGIEAGRESSGVISEEGQAGGGFLEARSGTPQRVDQIRQDLLRQGENEVKVQTTIRLTVESSGQQRYNVMVGPMDTTLYQADGDGDGVVDAHQPATGVHTGWIAIPAAGLAGTGAGFLARSVRARMGAK